MPVAAKNFMIGSQLVHVGEEFELPSGENIEDYYEAGLVARPQEGAGQQDTPPGGEGGDTPPGGDDTEPGVEG